MVSEDSDELVLFSDVRVVASTGAALLCRISGKLWRVGDRGTLFVRLWVASDRHLAVPQSTESRFAVDLTSTPAGSVTGRAEGTRGDRRVPPQSYGPTGMTLWSRIVTRLRRRLRRRYVLASTEDDQIAAGSANSRRRFWREFRAGRREAELQSTKRRS
jgi:hypothetical protein